MTRVEHDMMQAVGFGQLSTAPEARHRKLVDNLCRFRAGGDEATAALLEATVYPEEVTHCAAGVRWLTWLHRRAHAADAGTPADSSEAAAPTAGSASAAAPESDSSTAADPSVDDVLAMADKLNEQCSLERAAPRDVARRVGHKPFCACCGHGAPDANDEEDEGRAAARAEQAWISDALQFDTVEQWFHALVRKHFFGALKGPFNEGARHEAGLLPDWYLPLAAL